ncbi:hypothetical protein MMC11_006843 [Xylographa trunciseda]|nr:hypothetical protein [Xylographa trunciseda]
MELSSPLRKPNVASHLFRQTSAKPIHLGDTQHINTSQQTASTHICTKAAPLPSHITITPVTAAILPSFRRTISLILPIRYPNSFYTTILSDPAASSLSRAAIWHDRSRTSKRKREDDLSRSQQPSEDQPQNEPLEDGELVGAVRCRLEPVPVPPSPDGNHITEHQIYIQALALLSPYRRHGIATCLLETVITEALRMHADVSGVYAHVWEANEEGLDWYKRRGFVVEEPVIQGYYRRLKPDGARIVRREIGVRDWLRMKETVGAAKDDAGLRKSGELSV